jgi:hypothetical protein
VRLLVLPWRVTSLKVRNESARRLRALEVNRVLDELEAGK